MATTFISEDPEIAAALEKSKPVVEQALALTKEDVLEFGDPVIQARVHMVEPDFDNNLEDVTVTLVSVKN